MNGTTNLTNIAITPTQTVVTAQAGPMQVNVTFLNPIEVCLYFPYCLPRFTYAIQSLGTWSSSPSRSHTSLSPQNPRMAQLMLCKCTQMSAEVREIVLRSLSCFSSCVTEWNSGDRGKTISWTTTNNTNVIYHSVKLQTPAVFNEISNQAEWGNLYYAIKTVSNTSLRSFRYPQSMIQGNNITYKIGSDTDSRTMFLQRGVLDKNTDNRVRAINSQFPVFALSCDFGTIQATQIPLVWAIGYTTDPAISYTDLSGAPATQRSLYYKSKYTDGDGALVSGNFSLEG